MTEEGVDLMRRAFEYTYTPDTFPGPILDIYHADLVYHPRSDEPDPSPRVGREAFERLIGGFVEAFSEITFDVDEVIDAGEYTIAVTVLHGRGGASGAEVSDAYAFVYKVSDGLVVEGWEYRTKEEALEAVAGMR